VPSKQQHQPQARRNRAFAESIDRDRYPEWVAVAWFYCVLHLVDAFLAQTLPGRMAHPTNHVSRVEALKATAEWRQRPVLLDHYRALDTLSRRTTVRMSAGVSCLLSDPPGSCPP
jgi:hypothetical protein